MGQGIHAHTGQGWHAMEPSYCWGTWEIMLKAAQTTTAKEAE